MAGDNRQLAAPARTVAAERWPEVPARQAGAGPRTVPARRPRTQRAAVPARRPLMACGRIPRGTRAVVVPRRAQLTGPAGRRARSPETDRGGTARPPRAASLGAAGPLPAPGPPQAGSTGATEPLPAPGPPRAGSTGATGPLPAPGPPRAGSTGATGPLPAPGPPRAGSTGAAGLPLAPGPPQAASIAAAPGPRTTAGFVLPLAVRRARAPVVGPHRAAGLTGRPRAASAGTLRRVATSVPPGGQPTPGRGGPHRVTPGEARGPQAAPKGAGEIPTGRARGPRAKGRPRVMAAVTGHRGQPGAGLATAAQATAAQAPGTRHGRASGARTRPQRPRPAVT
jgi:hypothetical protein